MLKIEVQGFLFESHKQNYQSNENQTAIYQMSVSLVNFC